MKDKETTPPRMPDVTPPLPSGDYSYTLEVVMGMQNALGRLEQAVNTLTEESKETRKKVERMSHVLYAAGVVGTIVVAVLIFLANKLADVFIATMKTGKP